MSDGPALGIHLDYGYATARRANRHLSDGHRLPPRQGRCNRADRQRNAQDQDEKGVNQSHVTALAQGPAPFKPPFGNGQSCAPE